jgi:superfamily II DNA or RNA helicase
MPNKKSSATGSELFIVDNSDEDWKVRRYLHDWCQIARGIDIATGYFEIGAFLALKDQWQKVDQIRILMGGDCSLRTRDAFEYGLCKITGSLNESLEKAKETNDFLTGVPAIVEGIRSGKIICRVYRREKFHAKAYITHARLEVVGSAALVGSSNFTEPGITQNIELNVQITGGPVTVLQEWFEKHWNEAEDVTPEILRVIERHVREYSPYEVYAKALEQLFAGYQQTVTDWESGKGERKSVMFPKLDRYQQDGYKQLQKIADRYRGAFLCDGVGLGKTYVGLMLIEWLVRYERKRVALFVPKAGRTAVWEAALERELPDLGDAYGPGVLIFNHTDLTRDNARIQKQLDDVARNADVIIIDEAHHFRNPGHRGADPMDVLDPLKPGPGYIPGQGIVKPSRYRRLYDIAGNKTLFLLTATPVNNKLIDLQHMIELFSRRQADYFRDAPLSVHSLPGYFRRIETALQKKLGLKSPAGDAGDPETDLTDEAAEAIRFLGDDALFQALVVQRSRAYIRKSQLAAGAEATSFPVRQPPKVAPYELKKTYGRLLGMVEAAFEKESPLFYLPIYYPLNYWIGPREERDAQKFAEGRQGQVVGLVRTAFLKRFESSVDAFTNSCINLLRRMLAWVEVHSLTPTEKKHFADWQKKHVELVGEVDRDPMLFDDPDAEDDVHLVPPDMLEDVQRLDRGLYDVPKMLHECYSDLNQLADFLAEAARFKPSHDDKLQTLIKLLKQDPVLRRHKVLIFTEFKDTAQYLKRELDAAGIDGVEEIDSSSTSDRGGLIRRFSPYYNGTAPAELAKKGQDEIRILISTDVLSEGLNLQDATRLINYDLHWNPVRLMQRIGRVDRRMNPAIEARIKADYPEESDGDGRGAIRGDVAYWNFLPPDELNRLLTLYSKVTHKTLRISKTFGIEGRKLLTPEDEYDALKDFNEAYEGHETPLEALHLEYQKLLAADPLLAARLQAFPQRVFSGRRHVKPGTRAVFFCYARKAPDVSGEWTEAAGDVVWYLYTLADEQIHEAPLDLSPDAIAALIRSTPETPRITLIEQPLLAEIRTKVEKHIKNTYLKSAQAPIGVKPILKAWMELN